MVLISIFIFSEAQLNQTSFAQVDVRILKAVAIEHSKDVTEAIEAILFEVLPAISSPQEVLPTSGN